MILRLPFGQTPDHGKEAIRWMSYEGFLTERPDQNLRFFAFWLRAKI